MACMWMWSEASCHHNTYVELAAIRVIVSDLEVAQNASLVKITELDLFKR